MAGTSAITLVNRLRRLKRMGGDAANVNGSEDMALLELINGAMADVLTSRNWDFDLRHDGQLVTIAPLSISNGLFIINGDAYVAGGLLTPSVYTGGSVVARMVKDADGYGKTSFRVEKIFESEFFHRVYFDVYYPGDISPSDANMYVNEYLLPDSVRSVASMSYEETPLKLKHVDPGATFDRLVPRPHDQTGSPEWAAVGGMSVATYDYNDSEPDAKQRVIIWPLPSNKAVIKYSYYKVHDRLTSATDTIDGVPDKIIDDIVRLAYSESVAILEMEPKAGVMLRSISRARHEEKRANISPQPSARNTMTPWSGFSVRN